MYWIMNGKDPVSEDGEAMLELYNGFQVPGVPSWKLGRRSNAAIKQPILVEFEVYRGYQGPLMEMFDVGIPLMSERVAQALLAAGVTTLDLYQALLRNRATGQTVPYFAYNVTLLLAVADMQRSDWECYDNTPMYDVSFYDLVIDESRCQGELLFRLGQNVNALIVHDQVRQSVLESGIDTLTFTKPEDWSQL